jgi:hypothetical protein
VAVIYDIACQYSVNFWTRVKDLPERLFPSLSPHQIQFFIDKFHQEAHGDKCREHFSLYYWPAGQTSGSAMEQEWGHSKKLAAPTSEMAPNARHHTLDLGWHAWNWQLTTNMGRLWDKIYMKFTDACA